MPTAIITDARGIIESARFFGQNIARRHPDGENVEPNPGEKLWWLSSHTKLPAAIKDLPSRYRITGDEEEPVFSVVGAEATASAVRHAGLTVLRSAYRATLAEALHDPSPTEAQAILERGAEARRFWDARQDGRTLDPKDTPYLHAYRLAWITAGASEQEVTLESVAGELLSYDNIRRDFCAAAERVFVTIQNRILALSAPTEEEIARIIGAVEWPEGKYCKQASYGLCYLPAGDQLDTYSTVELESAQDLVLRANASLAELYERKKQVYNALPEEAQESKRGKAQKETLHLLEEASLDVRNALAKMAAILR